MKLNMIVAVDENNRIGLNNKLPWNNKKDMKYFSKTTKGNGNNAILMGKNTWLSLPKKPLPNRYNVIMTTTENYNGLNYSSIKNFNNDSELFKDIETLWIIGGSQIYNYFINIVDEIHISKIVGNYNCDTFFPKIPNNFKLIEENVIDENLLIEIWKK